MRIPFTEEQDKLYNIFKPYIVCDIKSEKGLSDDAPKEAIEALEKCRQIFRKQREQEIALMFD